ncbi:hypothetical protein BVX94_02405, partial [bacterium B17]
MKKSQDNETPRVIAWELTRRCSLNCQHCRGNARDENYSDEFTTEECFKVIDNIASQSSLINHQSSIVLILTGGEPMTRPDIYDISRYATDAGMHTVMAPCGHLITTETAKKMKEAGIEAISISIDGSTPEKHDDFRGVNGAYSRTIEGLKCAIDAGIPFQVNTTVTSQNVNDLTDIYQLAIELGAKTFDVFFLVPTGRGSELKDLEISAEQYENALDWIQKTSENSPIKVKTTCAPHYARLQKQAAPGAPHSSGGCMAGRGFVFISHRGELQPCGFFDRPCGDLRENDYDFMKLYRT